MLPESGKHPMETNQMRPRHDEEQAVWHNEIGPSLVGYFSNYDLAGAVITFCPPADLGGQTNGT